MSLQNPNAVFTRRHDLDWLRIIAFGLLIFYHIGMFYVTWGWHVKSPYMSDAVEPLMSLLNPWRLALLFFISGVAIRFLADKLGAARFALDRSWRLFPVILFGMYVVVAPQAYFELREAGIIEPGYGAFWMDYSGIWAGPWELHTPTWNHLWYVVYLFVYCLILAPFFGVLKAIGDTPVGQAFRQLFASIWGALAVLVVPVLPFLVIRFALDPHFPTTHNLTSDWAHHAHRLTILLMGYYAAKSPAFWEAVQRALPAALVLSIALAAILTPAWMNWDWVAEQPVLLFLARAARILYAWTVILALLGLAQRFLNADGPVRRYLTDAIFPYYILHQTIIVAAGYTLGQYELGVWPEFALVLTATIGGCALGYELIRRIPPLRPVMGLKWKPKPAPKPAAAE